MIVRRHSRPAINRNFTYFYLWFTHENNKAGNLFCKIPKSRQKKSTIHEKGPECTF